MRTFGLTEGECQLVRQSSKRISKAFAILEYIASLPDQEATCDECADVLDLTTNFTSPRITELLKAGCLISRKTTRTTRAGGRARVFSLVGGADFRRFLKVIRRDWNATKKAQDSQILTLGRTFLRSWADQSSKKARLALAHKLTADLIQIASKSS